MRLDCVSSVPILFQHAKFVTFALIRCARSPLVESRMRVIVSGIHANSSSAKVRSRQCGPVPIARTDVVRRRRIKCITVKVLKRFQDKGDERSFDVETSRRSRRTLVSRALLARCHHDRQEPRHFQRSVNLEKMHFSFEILGATEGMGDRKLFHSVIVEASQVEVSERLSVRLRRWTWRSSRLEQPSLDYRLTQRRPGGRFDVALHE